MTNRFQIQYKLGSVGNSYMELVEKNLESMFWAMKTKKIRKFGVQATILPKNTLQNIPDLSRESNILLLFPSLIVLSALPIQSRLINVH